MFSKPSVYHFIYGVMENPFWYVLTSQHSVVRGKLFGVFIDTTTVLVLFCVNYKFYLLIIFNFAKYCLQANFYFGKLPTIKSHDPFAPALPENNAVDVIRKHETRVRTTAFLREISQDYINASAQLMEPFRKNDAVEIIENHEEEFGRSYTSSYLTRNYGSADKSSSAKSRCSSRVSRLGAP